MSDAEHRRRDELRGAILTAITATRAQARETERYICSDWDNSDHLDEADAEQRVAMNRVWALLYNLTPDDVQNIADFRHKRMEQQ